MPLIAPNIPGGLVNDVLTQLHKGMVAHVPLLIGSVMNETQAWIPPQINATWEVESFIFGVYGSQNARYFPAYQWLV